MNNYQWHQFPNIGFISSQFSDEQLQPIRDEINKLKSNFNDAVPYNYGLAGHIEQEYQLSDSKQYIENLMLPFIGSFDDTFDYYKEFGYLSKDSPIVLSDVWVNFQKKHEFNPWHRHDGFMSFVIWMEVPYTMAGEAIVSPGISSNSPSSGSFNFCYSTSLGKIATKSFPITKDSVGSMILFPSNFVHSVYPFYSSDGYRISVAGNFKINI
jgi:hypothetical protein